MNDGASAVNDGAVGENDAGVNGASGVHGASAVNEGVSDVNVEREPIVKAASAGRCVAALSPPPAILLQVGATVLEAARAMADR